MGHAKKYFYKNVPPHKREMLVTETTAEGNGPSYWCPLQYFILLDISREWKNNYCLWKILSDIFIKKFKCAFIVPS
jgi:hypothetical protein